MLVPNIVLQLLLVGCSQHFEKDGATVDTAQDVEDTADPNDVDNDNDGFTENEGDCDDFNNTINPDAEEIPDNGVDEDCIDGDEITADADIDNDNDGFTENEGDCDDFNNTQHPGATDVPDNGIDEDCDGEDATVVVEIFDMSMVSVGDLIITEIMNNPNAVDDSEGEWFEIHNASSQDINLNGLELGDDSDVDDTIDVDLVIPSQGYMVFGVNNESSTNGGVQVDFMYDNISLTNESDSVVLSYDGTPLDRVAYDTTFPMVAGKSMTLNPAQTNNALNDNGTNWCYALTAQPSGDFGTPGTANDDCTAITIVDNDGDGYEESNDCDDTDASINPGATDIADNGIDEDCDGSDAVSSSADVDGDGFDDVAAGGTDCDDTDASINPDALDVGPDGIDNNCDGQIDENGLCSDNCSNASWNDDGVCDDGGPNAAYGLCGFGADCSDCGGRFDNDGDGYYDDEGVAPLSPTLELDCNDSDVSINPGMLDIGMDGIDQDCDGSDETGLCDDTCVDAGDGYCDDGGPNAQYSICGFGTDCSDCNPRYDNDGDGYYDDEGTSPVNGSLIMDCDDSDASVSPLGTEIPNDGIDQDCSGADEVVSIAICDDSCSTANDGTCDDGGDASDNDTCALGTDCTDCGDRFDDDGDGYGSGVDCNDTDATVNPGVSADSCDGVDNDCDGVIDQDVDTIEPNDASAPYYAGSLDAQGDSFTFVNYVTYSSDQDAFSFYLFDNTNILNDVDDWYCDITPPAGVDLSLEVFGPSGNSFGSFDNAGAGQTESLFYEATLLFDDSGTYTVVINTESGSSCAPVTVSCEKP